VLAGRPGVFSAGFDLGVLGEGGPGADALVRRGRDLLVRLYSSPVPVVAACTGHAVALGGVVLLACDYRVGATGDVRIGLNEVAIGRPMPPLLLRLAEQRLNAARRTEAVLLARIWTPHEAVDVGFTDEVVAPDEVVPTALSRAQDLGTRLQPDAFAETSRRMRTAATTDV
jgi:enoyl-CoA hydratase